LSQDVENTTEFPRDRFDDVERYTTQQGSHRQEFVTPKGAGHLNAIILAGGIALAIGVGSFLWLHPSDPLNLSAPQTEQTAPTDPEPQDDATEEPEEPETPEPTPTAQPTETPTPEVEPEPEPSPTQEEFEPTEEPTVEVEEPEATVDYSLPIGVYNASNIQGYAASVAQQLGGAGFNVPIAENWTGNIPAQTTVYFSDNEATALAVAEQVGAIAVYEPSVSGVLVVLTGN